jgi:hypothetical protein
MKQLLSSFMVILLIVCAGCSSNSMSGVYVCDQSQKKGDSIVRRDSIHEAYLDFTCMIESLDFKGNSTVELRTKDGPSATSYIVDKDYVRIRGTEADLLFKIKDNKTLTGEGIIQ